MTSVNVLIRRGWAHTVIGVLILVVMLFPLYWMLNVSLQSTGSAIATPWFPVRPSFDGYATAIRDQGGNLLTSLVVSLGPRPMGVRPHPAGMAVPGAGTAPGGSSCQTTATIGGGPRETMAWTRRH